MQAIVDENEKRALSAKNNCCTELSCHQNLYARLSIEFQKYFSKRIANCCTYRRFSDFFRDF